MPAQKGSLAMYYSIIYFIVLQLIYSCDVLRADLRFRF